MAFIGRERELGLLQKQFEGDGFVFDVVYGRRRVGKTRLLQEFIAVSPRYTSWGLKSMRGRTLRGCPKPCTAIWGKPA